MEPTASADALAVSVYAAAELKEEERLQDVGSLGGLATRALLQCEAETDTTAERAALTEVAKEMQSADPMLRLDGVHLAQLANIPPDVLAAAAAAALPPQVLEPIPLRAAVSSLANQVEGNSDSDSDDSEQEQEIHDIASQDGNTPVVVDAPSAPPRTEHEARPQRFAPALDVVLDGSVTLQLTGSVTMLQLDQHSVIIQHASSAPRPASMGTVASGGRAIRADAPSAVILAQVASNILDEGSLLALKPAPGTIAPRIIGRVQEVFGNISEPMYLVQLTREQCTSAPQQGPLPDAEQETEERDPIAATSTEDALAAAAPTDSVFHAVAHAQDLLRGVEVFSVGEYSSLVDASKCRVGKPTDASNRYDEEASDSEFSDDEAEAAARRAARSKRRTEQGVPDMDAAAAAAGTATSDTDPAANKRRRRVSKRKPAAATGTRAVAPPVYGTQALDAAAAATIAAQQAQIQQLQAHLNSMKNAMGSGATAQAPPLQTMQYSHATGHPAQKRAPFPPVAQAQAQGAQQQRAISSNAGYQQPHNSGRVPSAAALQFMAAAARAAANVAHQQSIGNGAS
jgi:hypothetical protein